MSFMRFYPNPEDNIGKCVTLLRKNVNDISSTLLDRQL